MCIENTEVTNSNIKILLFLAIELPHKLKIGSFLFFLGKSFDLFISIVDLG